MDISTFTPIRFSPSPNRNLKLNQCTNELFKTKIYKFSDDEEHQLAFKRLEFKNQKQNEPKTNSYLLNGLLPLFNFPKLDYFANILMTKILFGGLKKDSNLRIRSENYYISNGPLYNFPNRNLKLDQCAWPMSCSTHNFTNFLFTSNLLSIGCSKHEDSVNISLFVNQ